MLSIFSVAGVIIKNGSVLLTMEKGNGKVWSCPSFAFSNHDDPATILASGLKQALNLDVEPDHIIYTNETYHRVFVTTKHVSGQLTNTTYEQARWFDILRVPTMDVKTDSRLSFRGK